MRSFVLVVLGGAAGTLSRYGVDEAFVGDGLFPLATFMVNVVGAFALGLLIAALLTHESDTLRLLIGTGFLGGFTTYSALALETDVLLRGDHVVVGLAYAVGSALAGVAAAIAGIAIGSRGRA